ncbi:MAG: GHKL domain-containing protein [Lachnospiraceae bacterium]|nr:GHKL domain-containing protein [Lachnospiraceae bacterium]
MTEFLTFHSQLIVNFFDLYVLIQLLDMFLDKKDRKTALFYGSAAFCVVASQWITFYFPNMAYAYFVVSFCRILILTLSYQGTITDKLWGLAGSIIVTLASDLLVIIMFSSINLVAEGSSLETNSNLILFFSRLIFWSITTILYRAYNRERRGTIPWFIYGMELVVYLAVMGEILFLKKSERTDRLTDALILLISEMSIYLLIYVQDKMVELLELESHANLVEQQMKFYQKESLILSQKTTLAHSLRHDWKNRLQVISCLSKEGKYKELQAYIDEIEAKKECEECYVCSNNLVIDSILNSKIADAKELHMDVKTDIIIPENLNINTDDIAIILGNLWDNALEACQKPNSDRKISFSMRYKKGCLCIQMCNSFDGIYYNKEGRFLTRKRNSKSHGIGLQSVGTIVKKYNGQATYKPEDHCFHTTIFMYITQ